MLRYVFKLFTYGIIGANLDKLYIGYKSYRHFKKLNEKKKLEKAKNTIKTNIKPNRIVYQ